MAASPPKPVGQRELNDSDNEEEQTSWLPRTPSASNVIGLNLGGYFDKAAYKREDAMLSGLTLLDTVETFFDARIDLLERQLKKQRERLKSRASSLAKERREKLKTSAEDYDREFRKYKLKVSARLNRLGEAWQSAKVVRTKEKFLFFYGVMNVFATALLFGLAPEWIHIVYTVQALYMIPQRFFSYSAKGWGYFLADLCYFINILTLVFVWIAPWSRQLFIAVYCTAHGSLATAVITWRNSLVFHDHDKMVSLFIHMYPPLVLTVARHFYTGAEERFPALRGMPRLNPISALLYSAFFHLLWQGLYWRLLLVRRREKIKSGVRITSFQYLLKDKHGPIGKMLRAVNPNRAEFYFMMGQFGYSVVTELPAIFLLYDSPRWSIAFMITIFAASAWNGGGYYIEVFGRKFERELEALRKELAATQQSLAQHQQSSSAGGSIAASSPSMDFSTFSTPFPSAPNSPHLDALLASPVASPHNTARELPAPTNFSLDDAMDEGSGKNAPKISPKVVITQPDLLMDDPAMVGARQQKEDGLGLNPGNGPAVQVDEQSRKDR